MPSVSIAEAKATFARLVARAEAGEWIVITRHGKPVAQMSPAPRPPDISYGDLADRAIELDEDLTLPEELVADFEGRAT